jgi:glycosyltransferase involved in cell wall biosynthesis
MQGFSFIVCTHNPNQLMFADVIANLFLIIKDVPIKSELIIVDNNSIPNLKEIACLNELIFKNKNILLVREDIPGLTYARIAGFKKAKFNWLIFVDDDNLPGIDYLIELDRLSKNYPEVKCWGAGKIEVIYQDQKLNPFLQSLKPLFQERSFKGVCFSSNIAGEDYYPPGSSMCVERSAFQTYLELIEKGSITSSDRTGNSLNSAGDVQIIYCCIKYGFSVGCSDKLTLLHLIKKEKTKQSYLLRLKYALSSCQIKAFNEIFTDTPIVVNAVTNKDIIIAVYSHIRLKGIYPLKNSILEFASKMGIYNARILAGGFQKPFLLIFFEKLINYR